MSDDSVATPSFKKVFKAHTRAGWTFSRRDCASQRADAQANGSKGFAAKVSPPKDYPSLVPTGTKLTESRALGLQTSADACALWGVVATDDCAAEEGLSPETGKALWVIMGAVSAARLSASVLLDARWVQALLEIIQDQCKTLKGKRPQKGKSANRPSRERRELLGFLNSHCGVAAGCLKPPESPLSPRSAIWLVANLDALYYDLLQFFLRSGGKGPAIPPPHTYFPAVTAKHPGNREACEALLDTLSPEVRRSFTDTWQLERLSDTGAIELPAEVASDNPLLAVMWARFQEGSRLLRDIKSESLCKLPPSELTPKEKRFRQALQAELCLESNPDRERFSTPCVDNSQRSDTDSDSGEETSSDAYDRSCSSFADESESLSGSESDALPGAMAASNDEPQFFVPEREAQGSSPPGNLQVSWSLQVQPWPGDPALRAWRESGKECHYYAYAPPTRAALDILADKAPIVEIGAGMGYWAAALARRGVRVRAFDIQPPSPASRDANEFHGWIPAMYAGISKGGAAALKGFSSHTLFLCYPPFGSPMAVDCLHSFRGKTMCMVGEVMGDTANPALFRALAAGWRLSQRLQLPNWSDTAHELLVWERQAASKKRKRAPAAPPQPRAEDSFQIARRSAGVDFANCQVCGRGWTECEGEGRAFARCRWCRETFYCSPRCADVDKEAHKQRHALRWVHFEGTEPQLSKWRGSGGIYEPAPRVLE